MNIDKLEIEITASTQNASEHIKKLNKSLGDLNTSLGNLNANKLHNMAGGIRNLSTAMEGLHKATNGRDFTNLTKWIGKINGISSQTTNEVATGIQNLGNALTTIQSASAAGVTLSQVSNAMQKFGYKSIDKALLNIPDITKSLVNLLSSLSRAPKVSRQVTDLINAITKLAAQGKKVKSASKAIDDSLKKNDKSFSGFKIRISSVIGVMYTLYGGIMQVTRALRKLGEYLKEAIKNANEYGETFNYFEKSFGVIASKGYEEAGYKSAESYYEALKKGVMDASGKLSGVMANNGRLGLFGGKNLGLNATDTLRYQTQFTQIADSMGVASQNADRLGQVLIRLGGDLGSLKDEDFDKVWKNLTSGMVGMSRTMDKYGVNIRNAALEQTLLDLGINASINDLGQEDKVLLRIITTLRGTQGAWGDLAETINSNANQLRMLQANWQKLSMIIGGMFAGALAKILPIINAVMVALQKLASFVANLFGLTMDFSSSGVGGDISEWSDYFDEMGESAGGAANDVKKLKNQLLGIDELNVLSTQDKASGGGGVGGGNLKGLLDSAFMEETQKYLDAWNKAYQEMEDRVTTMANKIWDWLEPIRKVLGDIKNKNWKALGKDLTNIWLDICDSVVKALVKWANGSGPKELFNAIIQFVWGVGEAIYEYGYELGEKKIIPLVHIIFNKMVEKATEFVKNVMLWVYSIEHIVATTLEVIKNNIFSKFNYNAVMGYIDGAKKSFSDTFTNIKTTVMNKIDEIINNIKSKTSNPTITAILDGTKQAFSNVFNAIYNTVVFLINSLKNVINSIFGSANSFSFNGLVNAMNNAFSVIYTNAASKLDGILSKISQINGTTINIAGDAASLLQGAIAQSPDATPNPQGHVTTAAEKNTSGTNKASGSTAGIPSYAKITNRASGGFVDKLGLGNASLFWAGEHGIPEMLGTVGGRSAVVGGSEITGISDTIRSTSSAEMQLLRQQNELLMQLLAKPMGITENELFNSVRKSATNYTQMTGNLAF